jgi:stage III sporulation protein AA
VFECDYYKEKDGLGQLTELMKVFKVLYLSHKDFLRFVDSFDRFVIANGIGHEQLAEYEANVMDFYSLFEAAYIKGCADGLRKLFRPDQPPQSVLIAGAPSSGKTTLLRDLARSLSSFGSGCSYKTVVLDPRCELFPKNSRPGVNCDVFSAYPNRLAVPMAVRTFSPQLVVCDEVATAEEAAAIETGVNTGVRFLASIHAGSKKELLDRPLFRLLLEQCGFETVVLLRGAEVPGEIAGVFSRKELLCELDGGNGGVCSQRGGGLL